MLVQYSTLHSNVVLQSYSTKIVRGTDIPGILHPLDVSTIRTNNINITTRFAVALKSSSSTRNLSVSCARTSRTSHTLTFSVRSIGRRWREAERGAAAQLPKSACIAAGHLHCSRTRAKHGNKVQRLRLLSTSDLRLLKVSTIY